MQFIADQIGQFSLAGAQTKFNVRTRPVLDCHNCGWKLIGRVEGDQAVFTKPT